MPFLPRKFPVAKLLETAFEGIPFPTQVENNHSDVRVAIVGRPNVENLQFRLSLARRSQCGQPHCRTTRDSIDAQVEVDGVRFTLIDTAGIRRKKAEHEVVDKFAAVRTERAIDRADVCVLVVDAERGMTVQEKRIAREIEEQGKGCVLLFNKWDLVKGFRMEHCQKSFEIDVPFLMHCPMLFASATTGRNLAQVFKMAKEVHEQQNRRVSTGQLNRFVEKAVQKVHPAMVQGRRLRIFYLAQVDVQPPRFVLFVNHPDLMLESYKKYLVNEFRQTYGFLGSPVEFVLKGRSARQEKADPLKPEVIKETVDELVFEEEEPTEAELDALDPSYF